jgi:hypothetical protein
MNKIAIDMTRAITPPSLFGIDRICVVLFVVRDVLLLIVMFYVLRVNVYCHRVSTQLQLTNISISIELRMQIGIIILVGCVLVLLEDLVG